MTLKNYVLVAEDDMAIATGLAINLEIEGYKTAVAEDGEAAALIVASPNPPDLLLLDINMPRKGGLELLKELREKGNRTPVIVLSARFSESDKVAALRLGADDYVTKPFGLAELMARIAAVLRRSQFLQSPEYTNEDVPYARTIFGDIEIDKKRRTVRKSGNNIPLTHLEFELLCFFVDHPQQVLTRDTLLHEVWGTSGSPRTVDNFVGQLRNKLELDPEYPVHFLTVRGSGYRFIFQPEVPSPAAQEEPSK